MAKFPCMTDLMFYRSRSTPRWAMPLEAQQIPRSLVDECVNAHAGIRSLDGECGAHNLLAILRSMRNRGRNLERALSEIASNPQCAINPERRAAFARKWLRKIEGARA